VPLGLLEIPWGTAPWSTLCGAVWGLGRKGGKEDAAGVGRGEVSHEMTECRTRRRGGNSSPALSCAPTVWRARRGRWECGQGGHSKVQAKLAAEQGIRFLGVGSCS
jgi:hypothetical protein